MSATQSQQPETENVGMRDTLLRAALCVIFLSVAKEGMLPIWVNVVLFAAALFFFTTSITGMCLFNKLLNVGPHQRHKP